MEAVIARAYYRYGENGAVRRLWLYIESCVELVQIVKYDGLMCVHLINDRVSK